MTPAMTIILEGDGAWPDLQAGPGRGLLADHVVMGERLDVAVLQAGMESGRPSVMFRIDLPDGRVVLAETSLRLFTAAARAAAAKYPDTDP